MLSLLQKALVILIIVCAHQISFCVEFDKSLMYKIEQTWEISKVPSGFPVDFCLLTSGSRQYVAYYDQDRRMTVASRSVGSDTWQYKILDSKIGWDSHNYITMTLDRDGHLHVSGNMHCVKLIYFRTETAGDIATLKRYPMTGKLEDRVTYPQFLKDTNEDLIFNYRNGSSGRGMRIYNKYDCATRTWSRLLDQPLLDGQGKRNAYPMGPLRGPDGRFHMVWVWRDTPDCATNHHLSYARSSDLLIWETATSEKIKLPMTLDNTALCVDPIPPRGGIINGCQKLIFDSDDQPVIMYHKSDSDGNMQIYAARFEGKTWKVYQLTDWDKPVLFSGGGSMGFIGISISKPVKLDGGMFTLTHRHRDYGSGRLVIDEKTLKPTDRTVTLPQTHRYPAEMNKPQIDFEGIGIRRATDIGTVDEAGVRYILQWETLGRNFDRPRKSPLPEPSTLRLYKLSRDN